MDAPSIHAAIIMDGNGRWANRRGLPRAAGHRAGAAAVRRTIEAAPDLGISTLTLYAFSEDNWSRPVREVSALMKLLGRYLTQETARCIANGVRLQAIGRRDRLPAPLVALLEETERKTAGGSRLHLRLALDYSSRQSIIDAARRLGRDATEDKFSALIGPERRSLDSHQRGAASERFLAVGVRLRGAGFYSSPVAGFHRGRLGSSRC